VQIKRWNWWKKLILITYYHLQHQPNQLYSVNIIWWAVGWVLAVFFRYFQNWSESKIFLLLNFFGTYLTDCWFLHLIEKVEKNHVIWKFKLIIVACRESIYNNIGIWIHRKKHGLFASPRINFLFISAAMLPSSGKFSCKLVKFKIFSIFFSVSPQLQLNAW
jgi:hypothetical protein